MTLERRKQYNFGIANPADAGSLAPYGGVVIGSAFERTFEENLNGPELGNDWRSRGGIPERRCTVRRGKINAILYQKKEEEKQ